MPPAFFVENIDSSTTAAADAVAVLVAALLAKWQGGVPCRGTGCKTGATVSFNLYKIALFSY